MEFELYNIDAQTYVLKFIEPYYYENDGLIFTVDLQINPSSTYCDERNIYPWGI